MWILILVSTAAAWLLGLISFLIINQSKVNKMKMRSKSMMDSLCEKASTQAEWSICKVPSRMRELNEDAYTPRIVSIGPIHFGQENLQAMEVHKTQYMESIFQHTLNLDLIAIECAEAILQIEGSARSYYYEYRTSVSNSKDTSIVDILLVNGCFILELLLLWNYPIDNSSDPILGAATICCLQCDLAFLENQIPFFVLERLLDIILASQARYPRSLNQLCASFFDLELNLNQFSSGCKHFLDLIRNCYLPKQPTCDRSETDVAISCCVRSIPMTNQSCKQSWELIHCVTKLREFGIKFVKGTSKNLFDLKFSPKGVLEIPKLRIDDTMDALLRNMIAFQQCCHGTSYHITSYTVLMDYLIDSPADVEFLQHKRIVENYLGHGEEVSNSFNKISKKVFVEDFFFTALCKQVNEHSNKCWPRKRESFLRDYYFSPWKFIGVVAGSILLFFVGLQTGYTMASYHHPPK